MTLTDDRRAEIRSKIQAMSEAQSAFFVSSRNTPIEFQAYAGLMVETIQLWRLALVNDQDPEDLNE